MSQAAVRNSTKPDPITDLPFVRDAEPGSKTDGQLCYWHIAETGDWGLDCELGEALARRALSYMRETDYEALLSKVVAGMIDRNKFGGVEVGFMTVFANAAMRRL